MEVLCCRFLLEGLVDIQVPPPKNLTSYLWKVLLFSCLAIPGVLCSSEQKVAGLTDCLLYFIHFQQAISTYFIRALCYRF